jgi:hypothetical protein
VVTLVTAQFILMFQLCRINNKTMKETTNKTKNIFKLLLVCVLCIGLVSVVVILIENFK